MNRIGLSKRNLTSAKKTLDFRTSYEVFFGKIFEGIEA